VSALAASGAVRSSTEAAPAGQGGRGGGDGAGGGDPRALRREKKADEAEKVNRRELERRKHGAIAAEEERASWRERQPPHQLERAATATATEEAWSHPRRGRARQFERHSHGGSGRLSS